MCTTGAQLGEVLDHRVAAVAGLFPAPALHDALAEQRAFGDQGECRMVQQQALVQRRDADRQACLAGEEGRPAVDFLGAQLQSGQQLQQDFPASGRFGAEQYAAGELLDEPAQRSGSAALASIARFGSGRAGKRSRPTPGSTSSWLATTRGQFFSRAKQSSTGRNTSAGGSNGRSGSTRRSS